MISERVSRRWCLRIALCALISLQAISQAPLLARSHSAASTRTAGKNLTTVSGDLLRAIAIVQTDKAAGTGFLCRSSNEVYLLSNQHIMFGANRVTLTDAAGRPLDFDQFAVSRRLDLVKFTLSKKAAALVPPTIGLWRSEKAPALNAAVLVLGNSLGSGVITELRGKVLGLGPDKIEIDAQFVAGNSGSPIIDDDGKFLGVATYATLNAPTNWVTAGTRFNAVRRFGVRLENPDWLAQPFPTFCRETHHLEDSRLILCEYAGFIGAALATDRHGARESRKQCIERLLSYDRQVEQLKYYDPTQARYLVNVSNCMKADKTSLYPSLLRSNPDSSQRRSACNRLLTTVKNEMKKAKGRLDTKYSTQFLNETKDELAALWDEVDAAVPQTVYQQIMDNKLEARHGRSDL